MRYFTLAAIALNGVSCVSRPTSAPVEARATNPSGPVISRIVGRKDVIVVRAGAKGATYSLESKDGKVLVGDMTLPDLAANNPEMYRAVKTMEASVLWADVTR